MRPRLFPTDALDSVPAARNECNVGAHVEQPPDKRPAKPRRAAGDRHAESAYRRVSHVTSLL
jgi:hypothetical protein